MYSMEYIFIHNSYVENVLENLKMRGGTVKGYNSNVVVMSHVKYLSVRDILYNEDIDD